LRKTLVFVFLLNLTIVSHLYSDDIAGVARGFGLFAGSKAAIQWERIFTSKRRLQKYKLDSLNTDTLLKLKIYLVEHAADSEQPIVPGL